MASISPPKLPSYLADTHHLTPIVGTPTEEQIKIIHAAIRTQNSVSHVPAFNNTDLSMHLSQHLFDAQMVVHRSKYPVNPNPKPENIYTPPKLPLDVPGKLNQIAGPPTDEQLKSVHSALRYIEQSNCFDADLHVRLSQHLFDIQLARHAQYSGHITPTDVPLQLLPGDGLNRGHSPIQNASSDEISTELRSGFERMEQAMDKMHETMKASKDVLENVNRVLVSTQRSQTMVASFDKNIKSTVHMNPVNRRGILASECGLPLLRYWLNGVDYILWMDSHGIAQYLNFFEIGSNLVRGGAKPIVVDGMEDKAAKLLFSYIGIRYSGAQYYTAVRL